MLWIGADPTLNASLPTLSTFVDRSHQSYSLVNRYEASDSQDKVIR